MSAPGPHFVDANGLRFGYLEWGRGPLVLLFHGFPDTAHTWDQVGPLIAAKGFRVVAPWMRGYAPTGVPERDATTTELGADVIALIDALGASKASIVGHDWGAEAVNSAVGLAPQRVEKLVTVAIPHRARLRFRLKTVWAVRHFLTLSLPGALGRFCANDFGTAEKLCRRWSPTWRITEEDLRPVKECFRAPGSANAALGYYRAAEVATPRHMRVQVSVPTLAIAGADDPNISPADFEAVREHFTGTYEVVTIPGGHFCHRESPQPFAEAVEKFLA